MAWGRRRARAGPRHKARGAGAEVPRRRTIAPLQQQVQALEAEVAQRQALQQALRHWVIFLTGDILAPETRRFLEQSGARCLEKPFTIATVRRVVQEILKTHTS